MREKIVSVIGGGLAGCEAAWQLAKRGVKVRLYEMRPGQNTGAHHSDKLAELVCSNSLGSHQINTASSLLKEEMTILGSLILECAMRAKVPAGNALAVDRELFADGVTAAISNHPLITIEKKEVKKIPGDGVMIIATGPLTSPSLATSIAEITGEERLHFFDAAAPIIARESIDMSIAFEKSRYDSGDGVYLNCPMNQEQYENLCHQLIEAEKVELKDFEKDTPYFQGCLPVEVIASRGIETLRFGPMKPVGLEIPGSGEVPHAVVQLRQDNAAADLYNMVGFQTNLKWPEQKRVFSSIPGLQNAEFVRLGVMHRNTFINSPLILTPHLHMRERPKVFFAGQLTGVEGYTESTGIGLCAAINAARMVEGLPSLTFPTNTMLGGLIRYITTCEPKHFQPINSSWALLDMPKKIKKLPKTQRHIWLRQIAIDSMADFTSKKSLG